MAIDRHQNNQNKKNNRHPTNKPRKYIKSGACQRQHRCSLKGLVETYNIIKCNLTAKHLALIAKTPFHLIFKAIHEEPKLSVLKSDLALDILIQRYSSRHDGFKIGKGQYYRFETSDIKLIFGLTDGNHEIKMNSARVATSQFTSRLFPGVRRVSVMMLKSKLLEICRKQDNISIEDTVRGLCLLLIGTFLLPHTCTTIATTYYPPLDFIDDMSNYNWSKTIADKLRQSLKEGEGKDPRTVAGCTVFFLYWFFEHYEKMLPDKEEQIPRFRKWNLLEGCKIINAEKIDSILRTEFKQGPLQPSDEEMRDIGVVLLEKTELLTQSTPGKIEDMEEWETEEQEVEDDEERDEDDEERDEDNEEIEQQGSQQQIDAEGNIKGELDKLKERNLELEEENVFLNCELKKLKKKVLGEAVTSTCNKEEEIEGLRKALSESMDLARKNEEELEILMDVLSDAISGDYKKDREKMQADICKLHAQIEALNNEVGIEAKKRGAIMKSSTHLLKEKKRVEEDLEIKMRHIEKQSEHVELLTSEKVAQKGRIESMSKRLTGYIDTVKKLEVDNWKLAEASSNQISEIGKLTEVITDLKTKIKEKDKEIIAKKVKFSKFESVMKDLRSIEFQDSDSLDMPEPVEEEAAEMPPRKRFRSEFNEVRAPTKQQGIQIRELKVVTSEETLGNGKRKVIDVNDDTNEERSMRKGKVITLKKKMEYDIGMFLTDEAYDKLARAFSEEKLDAIVWQDKIREKAVFLDNILQAMDNQFISSTIIDAYAIEICKKNPAIADKSLFMSVICWDNFMRYASSENYDNELMDEIVSHASTKDLLFFPICTEGRHTSANHYTLLVRDMKKNSWLFYNSRLVRHAKKRIDPYFSNAQKLVYYVDDGLRRRMVDKGKQGTTWSKGSWIQCVTDIAQQPPSTNDCATLVCYYMFQIASGKQLKVKLDLTEVRKLKADLISTII